MIYLDARNVRTQYLLTVSTVHQCRLEKAEGPLLPVGSPCDSCVVDADSFMARLFRDYTRGYDDRVAMSTNGKVQKQ